MSRATRIIMWAGGGTIVFVAVVALGVLWLFRDSATPVTREDATFGLGSVAAGTEIGDEGLYVYETTGFETASVLGGSRHDYPAETFLSVRREGCGTVHRWQSLEERWDEYLVCDDGRLESVTSFHKWFGVEDLSVYVCDDSARVLPVGGETAWSFSCVNEGVTTVGWRYELAGVEVVEIASGAVEVMHIVAYQAPNGTTVGTGVHHRWVLADPYLVVKEVVQVENTTDSPVGPVDYTEEFSLLITSLVPTE